MTNPNEPTDPNKQTTESVSLLQIPIPSASDSPSPSSPSSSSSSSHLSVSLSHSFDSSPALHPLHPLHPRPPLSLTFSEVVLESKSESESHSHTSTNEKETPSPPASPSTAPLPTPQPSQTPHRPVLPLSLTIPLLAFTTHKSSTPLLPCGSITFTPEELVDASYDLLMAKVIVSIEKILLSQRDEAQKHIEWMGGMEGIGDRGEGGMGDGIRDGDGVDDIGNIGGRDTLTHTSLGNLGSGVGDVGLGSALRREKLSNFRGGALGMFGQKKSKGLRDKKDQKRRWEFRIYENPADRKPEGFETAEMRDARIIKQARERLEREQAVETQPVRGYVGENRENEKMGGSRRIRQNGDVGEINNDKIDENNPHPQQPNTPSSSLPPPTQSRVPLAALAALSLLPKNKECTPITLYIHWKPEPLIPAEYIERTIRMDPIVGSSSIWFFHLSNLGDGDEDEKNLGNGADDVLAGDERSKEGEDDEEESREEKEKEETSQNLASKVATNENRGIRESKGNERDKKEEADVEEFREEEENPAQTHTNTPNTPNKPIETTTTTTPQNSTPKKNLINLINLTPLQPSFPTHLQFAAQLSDLYGTSDDDDDDDNDNYNGDATKNSAGTREILKFLSERGGRDELIAEY